MDCRDFRRNASHIHSSRFISVYDDIKEYYELNHVLDRAYRTGVSAERIRNLKRIGCGRNHSVPCKSCKQRSMRSHRHTKRLHLIADYSY